MVGINLQYVKNKALKSITSINLDSAKSTELAFYCRSILLIGAHLILFVWVRKILKAYRVRAEVLKIIEYELRRVQRINTYFQPSVQHGVYKTKLS